MGFYVFKYQLLIFNLLRINLIVPTTVLHSTNGAKVGLCERVQLSMCVYQLVCF